MGKQTKARKNHFKLNLKCDFTVPRKFANCSMKNGPLNTTYGKEEFRNKI